MSKTFYGADVSEYQGNINWPAFNPGASFVFIKASEGAAYVDRKFSQNRTGVRRLGANMPHGFYHFANGGDPIAEANHFVSTVGPLQTGEVLALDWEISPNIDHDTWCYRFLAQVKARTGVLPLFYTNQNRVVTENWTKTAGTGCGLWVAHYGIKPTETVPIKWWKFYAFHQYSSSGSFPGIAGRVDTDAFFANAITDFYKYGKKATAAPKPAPAPVPAPAPKPAPAPTPALVPKPQPTPTPVPQPTTPPVVVPPPNATLYDWVVSLFRRVAGFLKGWRR